MLPEMILWKMKNNNRWNVTQCILYTYKRVLNEHDMLPYNLYPHIHIHICDSIYIPCDRMLWIWYDPYAKSTYIYADTHIYMYTHIYVCICSRINHDKFILLRSLYSIYTQTCLIQSWHVISSFILVYAYAHTQSHRPSEWWYIISSVTDDILICPVADGILCHIICYRK